MNQYAYKFTTHLINKNQQEREKPYRIFNYELRLYYVVMAKLMRGNTKNFVQLLQDKLS